MELDLPSHRRETMLFRGIGALWESARKKGEERSSLQNRSNPMPQIKGGRGEFVLATSRVLPRSAPHLAGGGTLSNGLAAEEVEGEGAEEGGDAVLAEQVEFDELPDGSRELGFQKLHFSTGGAGGLREEKNKPVNTAGFGVLIHLRQPRGEQAAAP